MQNPEDHCINQWNNYFVDSKLLERSTMVRFVSILAMLLTAAMMSTASLAQVDMLNVSYDSTRELYEDVNAAFTQIWKEKTGQNLAIRQSHGGSANQARAVLQGLKADVVTLALAQDIDLLAERGFMPVAWQARLPNNASPYTSTIVFLVRKDNPKGIHDWNDLVKPGISIVTPNPKTSGGARWNYLAAWAYAMRQPGADESTARTFVGEIYKRAATLGVGARGSTSTFLRGIGDVMLSWENEAYLVTQDLGRDRFDIVVPSLSILAEPPAAVVDKVATIKKTTDVANAYLQFLYSPEGQEIAAKHFFRPRHPEIAQRYAKFFPAINLVTIDDPLFGGWNAVEKRHFSSGGLFDQMMFLQRR